MTTEMFNEIIHEQMHRCEATLCKKTEERATEDKLHNFKQKESLESIIPATVLDVIFKN